MDLYSLRVFRICILISIRSMMFLTIHNALKGRELIMFKEMNRCRLNITLVETVISNAPLYL